MIVTDVASCKWVQMFSGFGGNCCSYLHGGKVHLKMDGYRRRWKQRVSSQSLTKLSPTTRLRFSKIVIFKTLFLYAKGVVYYG